MTAPHGHRQNPRRYMWTQLQTDLWSPARIYPAFPFSFFPVITWNILIHVQRTKTKIGTPCTNRKSWTCNSHRRDGVISIRCSCCAIRPHLSQGARTLAAMTQVGEEQSYSVLASSESAVFKWMQLFESFVTGLEPEFWMLYDGVRVVCGILGECLRQLLQLLQMSLSFWCWKGKSNRSMKANAQ